MKYQMKIRLCMISLWGLCAAMPARGQAISIPYEYDDGMNWVQDVEEGTYTCPGGVYEAGQTSYCDLPEVTTPRNKVTVSFEVEAASLDNVELSFQEYNYGKWVDSPLTVPGEVEIVPEMFRYTGKSRFKCVAKGGKVSDITIRNYTVRCLANNPHMQFDLSYWYDEDRDGNMEFSLGLEGKGFFFNGYTSGFYRIENGTTPVRYRDYPETFEDMKPCNVNNSGNVGYIVEGYFEKKQGFAVLADGAEGKPVTGPTTEPLDMMCDYDNNGLPDFLMEGNKVLLQMPDGSFMQRSFDTYTKEEYLNRDKADNGWNPTVASSGIVSGSMNDAFLSGKDMFIGGGGSYEGGMGLQASSGMDFNKDGFPDIVDMTDGNILLYVADDRYVSLPMGGSIYFRDLNNDQRMDYIVYEPSSKTVTAHICQQDGTEKVQQLISNLSMDQRVWCYDLDKDGDVDILLPFSYLESNGASFLVVMENDGSGHFRMHEMAFDEKIDFKACVDVDGDGYYDVLAVYSESDDTSDYHEVLFLKGDGKLGLERQPEPLARLESKRGVSGSAYWACDVEAAVIDHDGYYELLTRVGVSNESVPREEYFIVSQVHSIKDLWPQARANKAPYRPEKPSYWYEPSTGLLKVGWQPGQDDESSSVDLTYALRIGTAPGKGDVYYAHATESGMRLNLLDGNMGHDLDRILDASGWNAGTYYIAIQAIDPMHSGSAWSEEAVFEKAQLASGFFLSDERTVCDTLTLALTAPKDARWEYRWELGGAVVLSQNEDASVYEIRFDTPGEKRIALQTADSNGNVSEVTDKTFFVFANRMTEETLPLDPESATITGILDMDNDGWPELLTSNGVYESNGKGEYTKQKKIYNTNLTFQPEYHNGLCVTDVNKDGLADVLLPIISFNAVHDYVYHYINQGDKTLALESHEWKSLRCDMDVQVDFDNDGNVDVFDSYIYFNTGNSADFERSEMDWWGYYACVDMDLDGFFDLVNLQYSADEDFALEVHHNNGDRSFTEQAIPVRIEGFTPPEGSFMISEVIDMDNDGYPDLVLKMNDQTILILLNDRNQSFDRMVKLSLPTKLQDFTIGKCFDYDNNGFVDIAVQTYESYVNSSYILYIYEDWKTEWMACTGDCDLSGNFIACDLNNDGVPDLRVLGDYAHDYLRNRSSVTNTPPQAPEHLRSTQTAGYVTMKWDAAQDAETPSAQMRYNFSVKKQGAEGEGAYVISPMNGGNAEAAIVPTYYYPTSTVYSIPISAISAGTYEVRVQAIDAWGAVSPFSETYLLTVEANPQMEVPTDVYAGLPVVIRYTGNYAATGLTWDWDGGRLVGQEGNAYEVIWETEGQKQVSVTLDGVTSAAALYVAPAIDPSFAIYGQTMPYVATPVTLPEGNYALQWEFSKDDGPFTLLGATRNQPVQITYGAGGRTATATFASEGDYVLRLTAQTSCGSATCERDVTVTDALGKFRMGLVTVDQESGKYRISWEYDGAMSDFITSVRVYKEGSKFDDYRLLASVPVAQTSYVDMDSQPQARSSRYRIALLADNGIESAHTTSHQGVHAMLNKGMGNTWNMTWGLYEGADIETYRILRGTDANNLAVIAEVSGHTSSYTDLQAPEGTLYYALDFDKAYVVPTGQANAGRKQADRQAVVRSNVVCTETAADLVYAESVFVYCMDEPELVAGEGGLQLSAEVYPLTATFRRVDWSITEGDGMASIDKDGLLVANGNGNGWVTVRAMTVDGSGVYGEMTVPVVGGTVDTDRLETFEDDLLVYPALVTDMLHVRNLPKQHRDKSRISIFNADGVMLYTEETADAGTDISCGAYPSGTYIIKVSDGNRNVVRRFLKR